MIRLSLKFFLIPILLFISHAAPASPAETSLTALDTAPVAASEASSPGLVLPSTFGHNLSPSTYTLPAGKMTLGNTVAGAALGNRVTLGFSPWLVFDYNMPNLVLRAQLPLTKQLPSTLQLMYLKTASIFLKRYSMEAIGLWWTLLFEVSNIYRIHTGPQVFVFLEEAVPFSLRREPYKNDAYQWSWTSLHEVTLSPTWSFQGEFALVGMNYWYPNLHFGTSLVKKYPHWILQAGLSATGIAAYLNRGVHQVYNAYKDTGATFSVEDTYRAAVSVHPEVQIQWIF